MIRFFRGSPGLHTPIALLAFACGCGLPIKWGREPDIRPSTEWQSSTRAGARAFEKGRYDEADEKLATATKQAVDLSADQLAVARSLSNLAIVRRAEGDNAAARSLYQQALAIQEKQLGENDPAIASTLNNLAAIMAADGDYAGAEPLFERSLAIREKALGKDNRLTAQTLNNLGLLYAAQGRYGEAEPLYRRALAVLEKQPEPNRADAVKTLENYAALLSDTGRDKEALEMEEKARGIRAQTFGD